MIPPRIKHIRYTRDDDRKKLVNECAKALHMSKGEKALLKYYAETSSGFTPALQAIANKTKQNRSQVYRNRNQLIKHGVIAIYNNGIFIDWNRIKIFASLNPKLTKKGMECAPVVIGKPQLKRTVTFNSMLLEPMEELLNKIGKMTQEEYQRLCHEIRRKYHARSREGSNI